MLRRALLARRNLNKTCIEHLEERRLLCAVHIDGLPDSVLALFNDDGHIPLSYFDSLPKQYQDKINPHSVSDDRSIEEQFLAQGQPLPGVVFDPTRLGESTAATQTVYPDFIPAIQSLSANPAFDSQTQPGRKLMRFGTEVRNAGLGPATLVATNTANPDGTQTVYQRVYDWTPDETGQTDGTLSVHEDREAGRFVFHPQHGHLHFQGYATYELYTSENGQPGSPALRSDGTAVQGEKIGFCLINIYDSFTLPNGESSTTLPSYNAFGQPNTGCGLLQGVNIGRADVYSAGLDAQWIDVTNVPSGDYYVKVTLDADNAIIESNETNNFVYRAVHLSNTDGSGGVIDNFDLPENGGPNDTFATATDLGDIGMINFNALTIHTGFDQDWFKFNATSTGAGIIGTTTNSGNIDIYLYDENGVELKRSTGSTNGTSQNTANENISYDFVEGTTYYARVNSYNADTSNSYTLRSQIKPTIRASFISNASEDGPGIGQVRLTRNGPLSSSLPVSISLAGSATLGTDYTLSVNGSPITNSVLFDVESSGKTITITPVNDSLVEVTETINVQIADNSAYVVGADASGASIILFDKKPRILAQTYNPSTNTFTFDFSLDVSASLAASDLLLRNTTTNQTYALNTPTWDAANNRAAFKVVGVLPRGSYQAQLPAANVTHALGAPLFSSGLVNFNYLPGDLNLDGQVGFNDVLAVAQHYGMTSGAVFATGDADYDGDVDFNDLLLVGQNYGYSMLFSQATIARSTTRGGTVAGDVLA